MRGRKSGSGVWLARATLPFFPGHMFNFVWFIIEKAAENHDTKNRLSSIAHLTLLSLDRSIARAWSKAYEDANYFTILF